MATKKFECEDGIMRTERQYEQWLAHLQDLYEQEPNDLTDEEFTALQNSGLLY